jgi:hypothetical protein
MAVTLLFSCPKTTLSSPHEGKDVPYVQLLRLSNALIRHDAGQQTCINC